MKISGIAFAAIFSLFLLCCPTNGASAEHDIYIMTLSGSINPGVAGFVKQGIQRATMDDAACLVLELDTPGGLAESMREIVMAMLASRVPIVVYVTPAGARAASAGVFITIAADVAAMAPGTHIGAAHPVGIGGRELDEKMSEKLVNDMAAYAVTIAEKRGRNTQWVDDAVRKSVSITEKEALDKNVIDIIATDLHDLIKQVDGLEIPGKGILKLDASSTVRMKEDLRTRVLKTISDPNIAYILMMIGIAGLFFELAHPGAVLPGVVGGISIVLAFFGFHALPVNYTGIVLIILALIFFILEMKITSYGMLSIAGIVSMLLGSLMLFQGQSPDVRLSLKVLLPTLVLVCGFFIAVSALVFKSQISRSRSGAEGLVGETGIVKKALDPEGKVFVHGELWKSVAKETIPEGTRVRVVKVEGLVLMVERC